MTALDVITKLVEIAGAGGLAWLGNWLLTRAKAKQADSETAKARAETETVEAYARAREVETRADAEETTGRIALDQSKRADRAHRDHLECEKRVAKVEGRLEVIDKERERERGECDRKISHLTKRVALLEGNSNPPPAIAAE